MEPAPAGERGKGEKKRAPRRDVSRYVRGRRGTMHGSHPGKEPAVRSPLARWLRARCTGGQEAGAAAAARVEAPTRHRHGWTELLERSPNPSRSGARASLEPRA